MTQKRNKIWFFFWLQFLAFFLLISRLVDLQLIQGKKNRILAEENRIKKVTLPAGRGLIYDRYNIPLVENIPLYRIKKEKDNWPEFEPIEREQAFEIKSQKPDEVDIGIGRRYLFGQSFAHLLGFVGQVNKEEAANLAKIGIEPQDLIGRTGIEEKYDSLLRGKKGIEITETNALGERIRVIGKTEGKAGQDLHLALDSKLCATAFALLDGLAGAVITTKPKTGEILCLTSSPSFDPSKLSLGISSEDYQEILENPQRPFFNRGLSGAYPPGSTFKLVTAAAGLEEGEITKDTIIEDKGVINVGIYSYKNWYFTQYGQVEGEIDIVHALKRSTDTFFYKVGEKVGPRKLADWARHFGLGAKTGIDLPGEIAGLVPDPDWKKETRDESWFLGNTYHFAIGQADLLTTPLQVNMVTSVIADDGLLCQPTTLKIKDGSSANCRDLGLKKETIQLIKEGMKEACSPKGTAFPLFDFQPQVACKTGTAQFGDPKDRTHAWLTAFAPVENPEIVITVLVEAGGEGSRVAAPIVRKVLEEYFQVSDTGSET